MSYRLAFSFADGRTVFASAKAEELLLDVALRHGLSLPVDCREGVCGTCRGRCDSGRYDMDYVDEEALSPADLRDRAILACQTRVRSDAAFVFDYASTLCHAGAVDRRAARVVEVRRVSAQTVVLTLAVEGAPLAFLPGQYARLRAPGWTEWRAYSFANAPNGDNRHQFLIRVLPDGLMGRFLAQDCQPGTLLDLEGPFGSFYLREVERPLFLLAGGTGLAAFLGMLEEMAARHDGVGGGGAAGVGAAQPIRLYYGVTQADDAAELDRLEALRRRLPDFDVTIVVARPPEGYAGPSGYVTDHIDIHEVTARPFDMYVCGPPPMVEAVRIWLDALPLPEHRLYFEKFLASGTV